MATIDGKLQHLEWSIRSRSANQMCSLHLLRLFVEYEDIWKTKQFSKAAQDLIAVAFSLWRAAFLAEKTGKRAEVFAHGKAFLEKWIEDNTIAYNQDKNSREWTFNYYTRNARSSLQVLHEFWPEAVPAYEGKKRNATTRWDYCQQLLEQSVAGFEALLVERRAKSEIIGRAASARAGRKTRRAKVREITLAERGR